MYGTKYGTDKIIFPKASDVFDFAVMKTTKAALKSGTKAYKTSFKSSSNTLRFKSWLVA
jgi:hypothetical protein